MKKALICCGGSCCKRIHHQGHLAGDKTAEFKVVLQEDLIGVLGSYNTKLGNLANRIEAMDPSIKEVVVLIHRACDSAPEDLHERVPQLLRRLAFSLPDHQVFGALFQRVEKGSHLEYFFPAPAAA